MEDPNKVNVMSDIRLERKKKGYFGRAWGGLKYYAQTWYYLAFVYGKVRGMMQPLINTEGKMSKITEGVYIGDIASAYNKKEMQDKKITHIITAVLGLDAQFPEDFIYMNVPVRDVESEDMLQYLGGTTKFIEEAVNSGGKVLVHCIYGVSRSATIVAAWIMHQEGNAVEETIHMLKEHRECVEPRPAFRDQLEEYAVAN